MLHKVVEKELLECNLEMVSLQMWYFTDEAVLYQFQVAIFCMYLKQMFSFITCVVF